MHTLKSLFVLIAACAMALPAMASGGNHQYIFHLDSPIYESVETLFITQGKALPSLAKPWSQDEVEFLLGKLDASLFSANERNIYQFILDQFPEQKVFDFDAYFSPEFYMHTNTDFDTSNDWMLTYEKRAPLASVSFENFLVDHFYTYLGFPDFRASKNTFVGDEADTDNWDQYWLGEHHVDTNAAFFYGGDNVSYDANYPTRAFLAFGGKGWSTEIGRDRISWGAGETGNMVIDGHVQYHNALRLTAYEKNFKYTFVLSSFPSPEEIQAAEHYVDEDGNADPWSEDSSLKGFKMFIAHRFELRLWNDKIGFAVTEGIMYQPENHVFDFRILNPFTFYHNYYINSDANSILQLDLDWAVAPGWNLYYQMAIDEMRFVISESASSPSVHPDAFGFIFGAKNIIPTDKGIWKNTVEFAYTYPYLYLRRQESGASNPASEADADKYDNLNFIIAIRRWVDGSINYDYQFMGYPYGGDSIVFQLTSKFTVPGNWSAMVRLFYLVHGDKWMEGENLTVENSYWWKGQDAYHTHTPSGGFWNATRRLVLGFNGQRQWTEKWKTYGELDCMHVFNKDGVFGNDGWDVQCGLGASYSIF